MRCFKCNTELSDDAKFCPNCGEKVTNTISETNNNKDKTIENIEEQKNMINKSIRKRTYYYFSSICYFILNFI